MVLLIIISGILFGSSNIIDKYIKEKNKYRAKLTKKEIELIEKIEHLEIKLIKEGVNPDKLSVKEVNELIERYITK